MVEGCRVSCCDVVDGDTAVVEADSEQMRVAWVNVEAHDATLRTIDELWVGGVLQRIDHDHAVRLLNKVVCKTRWR